MVVVETRIATTMRGSHMHRRPRSLDALRITITVKHACSLS